MEILKKLIDAIKSILEKLGLGDMLAGLTDLDLGI